MQCAAFENRRDHTVKAAHRRDSKRARADPARARDRRGRLESSVDSEHAPIELATLSNHFIRRAQAQLRRRNPRTPRRKRLPETSPRGQRAASRRAHSRKTRHLRLHILLSHAELEIPAAPHEHSNGPKPKPRFTPFARKPFSQSPN